jgi:DNA-binding transcriptional LysR family regulator
VSFEHFQLFKDIVQSKSISRGAALNDISQSAASQQIQELERDLNIVLLDRSTRPFTVTPAGKLYFDFCRDLLRRKEQFSAALDELKGQAEGSVRVASIYSIGLSEMSRLESEFAVRHPSAQLQVEYLRPEKVYEAVLTDRADLGLVSYPEQTREITVIPWRQEEMVVAACPKHPLAGRSSVRPEDLEGLDFVAFDEDLPIHREVDRFLRDRNVEVNVTMHFDNLQMIKEAVEFGSGISIAPARVLQTEISQGRLVAIPIETRELFRPLGIVHRRKKRFTRAAQSFLALLQEKPAA